MRRQNAPLPRGERRVIAPNRSSSDVTKRELAVPTKLQEGLLSRNLARVSLRPQVHVHLQILRRPSDDAVPLRDLKRHVRPHEFRQRSLGRGQPRRRRLRAPLQRFDFLQRRRVRPSPDLPLRLRLRLRRPSRLGALHEIASQYRLLGARKPRRGAVVALRLRLRAAVPAPRRPQPRAFEHLPQRRPSRRHSLRDRALYLIVPHLGEPSDARAREGVVAEHRIPARAHVVERPHRREFHARIRADERFEGHAALAREF
mmetsp:Transcript_2467/g.9618  ORF Transcript_2467/g.9618 Transcript_2467/m.9618 type:complete len:258 (+) Transcript_2467:224-997(+)